MKANLATSHAICCDAWRNSGSFQTSMQLQCVSNKQGLIEIRFQYYSWLGQKNICWGQPGFWKDTRGSFQILGKFLIFHFFKLFFVCFSWKKWHFSEAFLDLYTCHSFTVWGQNCGEVPVPAASDQRVHMHECQQQNWRHPAPKDLRKNEKNKKQSAFEFINLIFCIPAALQSGTYS